MFASHYGLSNLCVMLDRNHLQIDGTTETVMNSAPLEELSLIHICFYIGLSRSLPLGELSSKARLRG